jgi:hypothetical protein
VSNWIIAIVAGMTAAVLAGLILDDLPPSQETPQATTDPPRDVIGTSPCRISDGRLGVVGTRDGHAFCFAAQPPKEVNWRATD